MNISLEALRSFSVLAEERHFTRAAARLHVAQPALSKRIQQLEAELGTALFVRDRGVALSRDGELLLLKARAVLGALDDLAATALGLRAGELGRLRIGFTPSAPHHVLPAIMRVFRSKYPGVDCVLSERGSEEQVRALLRGELDVALLRPPAAAPAGLVVVSSWAEPFVVVLPREHPLARRKSLRFGDLANERFVLVARRVVSAVHDQILAACRAAGFEPQVVQEGSQLHAVAGLVAAGCGISVLPSSAQKLALPDVVYCPLRHPDLRTIMAVAYAKNAASASAQRFAEIAASALKTAR